MDSKLLDKARQIRQLYTPIQPDVPQQQGMVWYQEWLPDARLQPFVYCYWQLNATTVLDAPFVYRVVADGCIDIFFNRLLPSESFVMGFCKKFTEFPIGLSFHYAGVRFLPTMFPQLFGLAASGLSNQYLPLASVLPGLAQAIDGYFGKKDAPGGLSGFFDGFLLDHLAGVRFNDDPRLYDAVCGILRHQGVLRVGADLDTGVSPRQLRRLFNHYVGDTAKTFSQLVRFQNILRAKPSKKSLRENKLFFDVGYYDQAHFIKAFKNFYGTTPSKAFGR